mgnify:CR=1
MNATNIYATPLKNHLLTTIGTLRDLALSDSDMKSGKHAAAILHKNHIVAVGVSHSSPRTLTGPCSVHAEQDALSAFHATMSKRGCVASNRKLTAVLSSRKKYDMIVIRCNKKGQILNSEPCKDCVEKIQAAPYIRKVYFTTVMFWLSFEPHRAARGSTDPGERKSCVKPVVVDAEYLL